MMDLQLNLSTSNKKQKKNWKVSKQTIKLDTCTTINFVKNPKLVGKTIAKRRNVTENTPKSSTFTFLKDISKDQIDDSPSKKLKNKPVEDKSIDIDEGITIHIKQEKPNNQKGKQKIQSQSSNKKDSQPGKSFEKNNVVENINVAEDGGLTINIKQGKPKTQKNKAKVQVNSSIKTDFDHVNKKRNTFENEVEEKVVDFDDDDDYDESIMFDAKQSKPKVQETRERTINTTESPMKIKQREEENREFNMNVRKQLSEHAIDGDKNPTFKQISALFKNNPEVPKIGQRHVKPVTEKLFTGKNFSDLKIHSFSISNLEKNMGINQLTVVQQKATPVILKGRDVLVRSQTGSGKTLAYALPIVEALQSLRPMLKRQDGVKALVIVPTRELAIQTYELFIKLVYPFTRIVPGYLIGGEKRKAEKNRIRKGFNILIGTPGRICDHLKHTASLKLGDIRCLILDEADRLLDMGYEKDVSSIVQALKNHKKNAGYNPMAIFRQTETSHVRFDDAKDTEDKPETEEEHIIKYEHELSNVFLSNKRQTVLLSATLTKAVETLAGLTMIDPVFIDCSEDRGTLIADSIIKTIKDEVREELDNEKDDLEIVPQESASSDSEEDDDDNEEKEDDSNESSESDSDEEVSVYKGLAAFKGLPKENPVQNKKIKKKKEVKIVVKEDDSDSDYDFYAATKDSDVTIITDSGDHSNPFQNAIKTAIAQDEMVIPSSVDQIYIVVPMKLRLVTLGALIIEKCVTPGHGKVLVFMGTQDLIDYHCEILSRVLTGKKPKKIEALKSEKKKKKGDAVDDQVEEVKETVSSKEIIENGDEDYEYDYDGIPLHVYEAKLRAEKAFLDVEFFQLHGSMDQKTRTEVFKTFRNAKSGVLLCTDVAARGLDLPHVDCIVQYTGPISATDYVHRVGRTARAGNTGTAVMFLLPSEVLFVRQLEERRIRLHQENMDDTLAVLGRIKTAGSVNKRRHDVDQVAATALQQTFEDLVEADKDLYLKACKAFMSWLRFYSTYPRETRAAFDRKALHAGHAAGALALRAAPKQVARAAPKDKKERPNNRLTNMTEEERKEMREKKKAKNRVPASFNTRPTSGKAAKRDRQNMISEFDSGMEPVKKKKKISNDT